MSAPEQDGAETRRRGLALHRAGRLAEAIEVYGAALDREPLDGELHEFRAVASAALGRDDAARRDLRRAQLLAPGRGSSCFNLASVEVHAGRDSPAIRQFRRSTALQPWHVESWVQRARTAIRIGRNREAVECLARAVRLAPGAAETWANYGNLLRRMTWRQEAGRVFRQGATLLPDHARLWSGLAANEIELDHAAPALRHAARAIAADPTLPDGHANQAQALYRLGRNAEAVRSGEAALALAPGDPFVRFNLATYLLTEGDLERGWDCYEARLFPSAKTRDYGLPALRWDGGDTGGKGRLMIVAEQGLGDEVLFASCLPDVARLLTEGALDRVAVECAERLLPLFARSFPRFDFFARLRTADNRLGPVDYAPAVARFGSDRTISAGSLPRLFRPSLRSFPASGAFLGADPGRIEHWRRWLDGLGPGPRIGLTWRSRAGRDRAHSYYPGRTGIAPVLALPGIRWVNLQYDAPEADLAFLEDHHDVAIARPEGIDLTNDLDDLAALISALDSTVSAYTVVINLCGALGRPCYTVPYMRVWPQLGTAELPWYPSVRLEARAPGEDWEPAMARLARRLAADLGRPAQ